MTEDQKNGIVEKIRKLLRLARDAGATEAEAATAMAMAQKLMLQHDIDNVEEVVEQLAMRGDWQKMDPNATKWQRVLAQAVAKLYNCRTMISGSGKYMHIQFVGKASHVLVCADTLQWIIEQVNDLHKQALVAFRDKLGGSLSKYHYRDFRHTFKEACAMRIYQRAEEIVAAARNEIPHHMALVVIDQSLAAADDLIQEVCGGRKGRSIKLRKYGYGTGAGHAAGNKVQLQHKVK